MGRLLSQGTGWPSRSRHASRKIETGPNRVLGGGVPGRLDVRLQARIPAFERRPQGVVQDTRADLEQQVRTPRGPPHLLLLDHPLADHLIDRRFRKRRRDPLAVARPIPVIRDEGPVGLDVVVEFARGLEQLLRPLGSLRRRIEVALQVLDDLQGPVDVAVPEVPLGPGVAKLS